MSYIDKSFMLELSYRLTVAVNMAENKLESLSWMKSWNAQTHACATRWYKHLGDSIVDWNTGDSLFIQTINEIVAILSQGYAGLAGPVLSMDAHVYELILQEAHKLAHAPVFADWELAEFYILGQQLARDDLRARFAAANKPELPIIISKLPPFVPLSENSFPRLWPGWPRNPGFNDNLVRYVVNRQRFGGAPPFSMGPLASLLLSIACPTHFPTTIWCWQDWEGSGPWHLFIAGGLFSAPSLVTVKDANDKAFVLLLETMDRDKKAGNPPENCGWMLRSDLWPDIKTANTRSKAWSKLTKKTLSALGEFEFKGQAGQNKETGGVCRVPATLAGEDCRIFVEKTK